MKFNDQNFYLEKYKEKEEAWIGLNSSKNKKF